MADNHQLLLLDDVGDGDDVFVYTGGDQEVPGDVKQVRIAESIDTIPTLYSTQASDYNTEQKRSTIIVMPNFVVYKGMKDNGSRES